MLAWKKSLGISPVDGIVSPAYGVYRSIIKVEMKYFHFTFRTDLYASEFKRNSSGIIESRLRLYSDKFFSIFCVLPPLKEQTAIAQYLDEKTNKIDQITAN